MNDTWSKLLAELETTKDQVIQELAAQYIVPQQSIAEVMIRWLGVKLSDAQLPSIKLHAQLESLMPQASQLCTLLEQDVENYYQRDFACESRLEALLFHRGFQALASFRFAHAFWCTGKRLRSKWLANRAAELWGVDIHPAATIGAGLVMDHCMGIVIGETSEVGDNVFLFHNVTLGGTGRTDGDRHPKVGSDVVIGTGATVLGNIRVGDKAVIAAGAMVLEDVPAGMMVAGIPAKVKGPAKVVQ